MQSITVFADQLSLELATAIEVGIVPKIRQFGRVGEIVRFKCFIGVELVAIALSLNCRFQDPLVVRVIEMYFPNFVKSFVYKNERDESREYFFSEAGEEAHHCTCIESHKRGHEKAGPESNPEPEIEVRDIVLSRVLVDDVFKDECRACSSENDERLTGSQGVDNVAQSYCSNHLQCSL